MGSFAEHRNEVWHALYGMPLDTTPAAAAAFFEHTGQTEHDDYRGLVAYLHLEAREWLGLPYGEELQDDPSLPSEAARVDHTCPVAWASEHGVLDDRAVMKESWCISHLHEKVLRSSETLDEDLRLYGPTDDGLTVQYAPFDWVNPSAKVMLVGITPGKSQSDEGLKSAQEWLRQGRTHEEALRHADATGSFAGRMRVNLVSMLDDIGVAQALKIDSTEQLFGERHDLASLVSAITFPVFLRGRSYSGHGPELIAHRVLRNLMRASLGPIVRMVEHALVVPLGAASMSAVGLLVEEGYLDEDRCLFDLPHPSPALPQRKERFEERRSDLEAAVRDWAASHQQPEA